MLHAKFTAIYFGKSAFIEAGGQNLYASIDAVGAQRLRHRLGRRNDCIDLRALRAREASRQFDTGIVRYKRRLDMHHVEFCR